MDYSYAYTTIICFFATVWVVLFCLRKDLRREMLTMSLLAAPLGPVGDFFYQHDYYLLPILNGQYWWLYSLVCGFFYGGVAAVLYETLLKKHHHIQPPISGNIRDSVEYRKSLRCIYSRHSARRVCVGIYVGTYRRACV